MSENQIAINELKAQRIIGEELDLQINLSCESELAIKAISQCVKAASPERLSKLSPFALDWLYSKGILQERVIMRVSEEGSDCYGVSFYSRDKVCKKCNLKAACKKLSDERVRTNITKSVHGDEAPADPPAATEPATPNDGQYDVVYAHVRNVIKVLKRKFQFDETDTVEIFDKFNKPHDVPSYAVEVTKKAFTVIGEEGLRTKPAIRPHLVVEDGKVLVKGVDCD